ncbi:MAG TPA: hypothetical protein GXX19_03175 [Syntrophomonadaceae bacterium]|nr:hypothetical protein [Syntrophomonadaceae bacterium]
MELRLCHVSTSPRPEDHTLKIFKIILTGQSNLYARQGNQVKRRYRASGGVKRFFRRLAFLIELYPGRKHQIWSGGGEFARRWDLEKTRKKWKIIVFHWPPYCAKINCPYE